jgi:hypothetical protein
MSKFGLTALSKSTNKALVGDRLPVRWEKTAILVMNEVRVSHPYLPDNVLGGPPAANERVRKVVRSCSMPQG